MSEAAAAAIVAPSSSWWTWQTWLAIILVLALFGINVFHYLSTATEESTGLVKRIVGPVAKALTYFTLSTTKEVVENTATGTKAAVSAVEGAVVGGIDKVTSPPESDLSKAISTKSGGSEKRPEVAPAEAGWCLIGTDKLVRSCVQVGVADTCMSGDVFPTKDVCVHPSLRP
jgi:hypothetical protein